MTGKERIRAILNRQPVDRSAFWMGNPEPKALAKYQKDFNVTSMQELSHMLNDDLAWVIGEWAPYNHPQGKPMWDFTGGIERKSLSQVGIFCDAESVEDIVDEHFPKAEYIDFDALKGLFDDASKREVAVFGGMWSFIWHILMDIIGMESCFMKMYTHPEIIHAIMNKVTNFYLEANEILLDKFGDQIDVFFFGNDMGSQLDCLISPDMYREFVFPYYQKLINLAKSRGKKVALHSCGAIQRIIPDIIKLGVDVLHPIQAAASGMQAANLLQYSQELIFMGGVDTQDLLPFQTPQAVKNEVYRLRKLFGKHFICSPSHEALLENVSAANLLALSQASISTTFDD